MSETINRTNVIKYISDKFTDKKIGLELSPKIEEELFQYTTKRTSVNEIRTKKFQFFNQRYNYKLLDLIMNIKYLEEKLIKKEISVSDIFNKNQIDLFTEKWEISRRRKEEEEKFLFETHLISNNKTAECFKCKTVNTYVRSQQTRSADEPETIFYLCLTCGNHWKK